jgi:hypothetical protein
VAAKCAAPLIKDNGGALRRHYLENWVQSTQFSMSIKSNRNRNQTFYILPILQDVHRHMLCCNRVCHLP